MAESSETYDFVIVGSGFGGSISAMRLAQKGYSVAVLEMGKEYTNSEFPKTNWDIRKYLWFPLLRCFGIQKISLVNKIMALHGVGVGGGSLVYANTLLTPEDYIFKSQKWPREIQWEKELSSFYKLARKMLGSVTNKKMYDGEKAIEQLAKDFGVEQSYHPTEVGVFFGNDGEKYSDPYFSGKGPDRVACNVCGACMIGCPTGAKNTLDKNYLYFARKWGAQVIPETKVTKIIPKNGEYLVETVSSTAIIKKLRTFKAKKVIVAAGVLGTINLLLKNKLEYKTLPHISEHLGDVVRSNNESLLGVTSFDEKINMSKGIAIGAGMNPDSVTKIEGVRYPEGSDLLRFLAVPLTGSGNIFFRPIKFICVLIWKFPSVIRLLLKKDWSRSTLILLVMQSIETDMKLVLKRSFFFGFKKVLKGKLKPGQSVPSYIPVAQKAAKQIGKNVNGLPQNIASEVLMGVPATAHLLGGAILSSSSDSGVVNTNHEVYGHPGLYVCDASVIPSNLAVNPSLTISALSERFASKFPNILKEDEIQSREINFSG